MFVSVVGDSISTFEGYVPQGYAVYYDGWMNACAGLNSVYDMWWAMVIQWLQGYLCVNNSYSGSRVTGDCFPAAACAERMAQLHLPEWTPELILVYIGFNDFAIGVPVDPVPGGKMTDAFSCAYREMLRKLRGNYPGAAVVCGTISKSTMRDDPYFVFPDLVGGPPLMQYNDAIRSAAQAEGCLLADIAALERPYESMDGTHPTAEGQSTLAKNWLTCLHTLGY